MKIAERILQERTDDWYADRTVRAILMAISSTTGRPISELNMEDVEQFKADTPLLADVIDEYREVFAAALDGDACE